MVPLDRALESSYRLSIVTMSLTAAVWPQFATQVFRGGIGRLTCIGSYVNKQVTTFTFRAQATTCSRHHTRTVMDAGCEYAQWVRSANPSDSWALVHSAMAYLRQCSLFQDANVLHLQRKLKISTDWRQLKQHQWMASIDSAEKNETSSEVVVSSDFILLYE